MTPQEIKQKALALIDQYGLINLERAQLCAELGIAPGSFHHYAGCNFGEFIEQLRQDGHTGPDTHPTKSRTSPELRRASLLKSALVTAEVIGYNRLTRADVALAAGVSAGLITNYFGTIEALRQEVARAAVEGENAAVIAQGLVNRDPIMTEAPESVKALGIEHLTKS